MKNTIFFAALALAMNSSAQNFTPSLDIHIQTLGLMKDIPASPENGGDKIYGIHTDENFGNPVQPQIPGHLTTVQLNDSIYIWRWDTTLIGWTIASKIINIVYDDYDNLTSLISQNWDGTAWVNEGQYTYAYDTRNNIVVETHQSWVGSEWLNSSQTNYTYDFNNNLTSVSPHSWHDSAWVRHAPSFIFTYDTLNNKTSEIQLFRQYAVSILWTYDANNNKTSEVHQFAIYGPFWETQFQYRYIYTYDANNNKTSEIVQLAEEDSSFVNTNRFTYTYDDDYKPIIEINQEWVNGAWENYYKDTSLYDDKNLISKVRQSWMDSVWMNSHRDLYTYDINHNQTSKSNQYWDGSDWVNVFKSTHSYEANKFLLNETNRYFDSMGVVIPIFEFDVNWKYYTDSIHYYFHTITAVNELNVDDDNINVYPNPCSGKFTISSKNSISAIEIYNLRGERIYADYKINLLTSFDIDLSGHGKGIYFINIYNGMLMYNHKVIVQ